MLTLTRILCPTDFSEISLKAEAYATALARRYDAQLLLSARRPADADDGALRRNPGRRPPLRGAARAGRAGSGRGARPRARRRRGRGDGGTRRSSGARDSRGGRGTARRHGGARHARARWCGAPSARLGRREDHAQGAVPRAGRAAGLACGRRRPLFANPLPRRRVGVVERRGELRGVAGARNRRAPDPPPCRGTRARDR